MQIEGIKRSFSDEKSQKSFFSGAMRLWEQVYKEFHYDGSILDSVEQFLLSVHRLPYFVGDYARLCLVKHVGSYLLTDMLRYAEFGIISSKVGFDICLRQGSMKYPLSKEVIGIGNGPDYLKLNDNLKTIVFVVRDTGAPESDWSGYSKI